MLIGELTISTTYKLQVNKAARKSRHKKLISSMGPLQFAVSKASALFRSVSNFLNVPSFGSTRRHLFGSRPVDLKKMPLSVQSRIYRRIGVFASSMLIVMSFSPSSVSFSSYIDAPGTAYEGDIVIADGEGYLTKLNPQTNDGDRSTMSDSLTHTVEQGETLSVIAAKYGLKMETVMWENDMYNAHSLKIGQELIIPPADGVYHKVKKGEVLSKIATKYKIESSLIAKQNTLADDAALTIGQELFIPGAKGTLASPPRTTFSRTGATTRGGYVANHNMPNSTASAKGAFIWPTSGKVTQGYHRYHNALDIAKWPGGPVWASKSGVVIKVKGGYSGGYGNHVVIDHGGGIKTLSAHLEYPSVKVGDQVTQGQVIGKMGKTGRVYGRTGVHLHFEVWKNGVKQNPWNYL